MDIDFFAFAGDCRIAGTLDLEGERLTDMLNAHTSVVLRNVLLESLDDGHVVELPELELERGDLFAVEAGPPRGREGRRIRTRAHRLQVSLGPYVVLGSLHTYPGADPMSSLLRRGPMLPLTNATIVTIIDGRYEARDAETLIVNRELAEWIRPSSDEHLAFPNVPILAPAFGPESARDLAGIVG